MGNKVFIADVRTSSPDGRLYGHYASVARNYLEIFGADCRIAGGPAYSSTFPDEDVLQLPFNVPGDGLLSKFRMLLNAFVLFRCTAHETVVIQQSSVLTVLAAIILLFHTDTRLFMIMYDRTVLESLSGRILFRCARRKISGLICPSDEIGRAFGIPYIKVTDYIRSSAPEILPFCDRTYDYAIVGSIWPDKGVLQAVRRFRNSEATLLVAGQPSDEHLAAELSRVAAKCPNVTLRLERLSDTEYREIIRNSRYCIINYQGTYESRSSGVVLDIIHQGTPVIGRRCAATAPVAEFGTGRLFHHIEDFEPDDMKNPKVYMCYIGLIRRFVRHQALLSARLVEFVKFGRL